MQFQVPQFIETEDKLLGPLTIRQFIYLSLVAGISFILFFMLEMTIWVILSVFMVGGTLIVLLGKVNGQPMTRVVYSAFFYYWKPQTYVWQPDNSGIDKTEAVQRSGFSMERLIAGVALKDAWQSVQTGSKTLGEKGMASLQHAEEKYEILRKISGDQRAARRVDYR